jgi:alpha/beta hydrolase family protein DUF900
MVTTKSSLPIETIVIIHGTFSNAAESLGIAWWWPGSSFCANLDRVLERQGIRARCWGHVEITNTRPIVFMGVPLIGPGSSSFPFSWTGENLESRRRQAADSLRRYLADLQNSPRVHKIHIIAHSHGGNIVTRAIRDMKAEPSKLGAVIFLGTPFFGFDDEGRIRDALRRINWPIVLLGAVLWAFMAYSHYAAARFILSNGRLGTLVLGLIVGLVYMLVDYYKELWTPLRRVRGVSIVFPGDEAVGLLKKCAAVALDPHIMLHEFLKDHPLMRVGRKEAFLSSCNRIKLVGSALEGLVMLGFMFFCRPYRPRFRLFFGPRIPGFRESFVYFKEDPPEVKILGIGEEALAALFAPSLVAMSRFLFLPIDFIIGAFDWVFQILSRFSIWVGMRAAARKAFGIDILASAFQMTKVATSPEGVCQRIVEPEVQARVLREIGSLDPLRVHVIQALQSPDILASVNSVKIAFQSTDLLHAQYYKDPSILEYIAQEVATRSVN